MNGEAKDKFLDDPLQEILHLSTLQHENIVKFHSQHNDGRFIWCVMEYCHHGDLFRLVQESEPNDQMHKEIFTQILNGVSFIHDSGFAHIDLKPDNILIFDKPKLCDFGMMVPLHKIRSDARGTTRYMAPEVFNRQSYEPLRADIWSLGVILFVLQFRKNPWNKPDVTDERFKFVYDLSFARKHVKNSFARLLDAWKFPYEERFLDLLCGMLCAPKERMTLREILQHEWLR